MITKVNRPTTFGLAFVDATVKIGGQTADNWIARRVVDRAINTHIGMTADVSGNAKLKYSTAQKLKAQGVL